MHLNNLVQSRKELLIQHRRWFHQYPELSYQEFKTQERILEILAKYPKLEIQRCARTGIVADLNKGKGNCLAIRADMDALPLYEQTGLPFHSKHDGVMHACGHDVHMAVLLTIIDILVQIPVKGWVRFIFQPSEENNFNDEEGLSGAQRMIKEGVLDPVDKIIGFHQRPQRPAQHLSIVEGAAMASSDAFKISIQGKAAHAGAAPQEGIDAVVIAAELIQLIQKINSRWTAPEESLVVSVSTINGGRLANIIADKVQMTGTIRTRNMDVRKNVLSRIQKIIQGIETIYDASIDFEVEQSLPVTNNDITITKEVRVAAEKHFSPESISHDWRMMAAEDFSFYSEKAPSCFFFFGTQVENEPAYGLHHPKMQVNEQTLLNPVLVAVQWVCDQFLTTES